MKIGNIIVWGLFIVAWILEYIYDYWLIHLLFVVAWIGMAFIVVKFIKEVIKWHKQKKLN